MGVDSDDPAGDKLDVEALYRRDAGAIHRFARRAGASEADAEDLTQAAFLKAIERPPAPNDSGAPGRAWLHTVAANLMRDRWRQSARAQRHGASSAGEALAAGADQPEEATIAEAERLLVRAAMAALPEEARRILLMRVVEGRSSAEVAKVLGRTADSVRQAQLRALQSLERQLRRLGWAPHADDRERPHRGGAL
jgi:RNA polymerase sigma-70 factor (ECF subfamily)